MKQQLKEQCLNEHLVERFGIEKTVIESSAVKEMVTVEKIGS